MKISVIIPVLNEAENLIELLPIIFKFGGEYLAEVIVVDGGSNDDTVHIARTQGAILLRSQIKSRAAQLNRGASEATGGIFYFVHADSRPHEDFAKDILESIRNGNLAGCYQYKFNSTQPLLKMNAWFTRFNGIFSGGGDQTLFIARSAFEELQGFDEYFTIMEDFELVGRIKRKFGFTVLPKSILVSARKYETNSWLRVQLANLTVFMLYYLKRNPNELKSIYHKMLKYR
ncbi:transferase 2, rSAM/selenodomain-associated [Belliella buryatensis]|uniref:Transferase 2, rSAM/selenodomain-associated n=1 Tax=Belliella buryatensis TaxID=1500549 RepID=A0A239D9R8_9BACT|nr:TIGR04283 family arsenosugar biosynthesis glycosyltransferase [Belliella buryatensis]SNS29049.1 transferase 2, rSAM/selenodomain-associated [Belliella buryatensis]